MNLDPVYHCCHTDSNLRWGEAIELGEKILPPFKRFHGEKVEYSRTHFTPNIRLLVVSYLISLLYLRPGTGGGRACAPARAGPPQGWGLG